MAPADLKHILDEHAKWLADPRQGKKANLSDANLSDADLRNANLSDANLSDANLRDANLSDADLRDADLRNANLSDANLRNANLRYADLSYANLRNANLRYADLRDANLRNANLRYAVGNGREIKSLQLSPYSVVWVSGQGVFGGCTRDTVEGWLNKDISRLPELDAKYYRNVTVPFIKMCEAAE